ncbi:MAG: hypothetical protein E7270_04320 [Lachnospiraceae bacterium]|nr:hypothetical protein [Lachnospiraceae bacterium]
MRILVDGDACPVVKEIEEIAMKYNVHVIVFADTAHVISSDYCEVKVVDKGPDAVDFAIMSVCKESDIVVTQDYGVAAMALGKKARVIHQSGIEYTDKNIDRLLMDRYIAKKECAKGRNRVKSEPMDKVTGDFVENFTKMIEDVKKK